MVLPENGSPALAKLPVVGGLGADTKIELDTFGRVVLRLHSFVDENRTIWRLIVT
jgi:hypothetical protein